MARIPRVQFLALLCLLATVAARVEGRLFKPKPKPLKLYKIPDIDLPTSPIDTPHRPRPQNNIFARNEDSFLDREVRIPGRPPTREEDETSNYVEGSYRDENLPKEDPPLDRAEGAPENETTSTYDESEVAGKEESLFVPALVFMMVWMCLAASYFCCCLDEDEDEGDDEGGPFSSDGPLSVIFFDLIPTTLVAFLDVEYFQLPEAMADNGLLRCSRGSSGCSALAIFLFSMVWWWFLEKLLPVTKLFCRGCYYGWLGSPVGSTCTYRCVIHPKIAIVGNFVYSDIFLTTMALLSEDAPTWLKVMKLLMAAHDVYKDCRKIVNDFEKANDYISGS